MFNAPKSRVVEVLILGGGVSGLAFAYALQKKGISFALLEKEGRVGGWVESCSDAPFFFERGPRSLRPSEETEQLLEELGLTSQIIQGKESALRRYLYTGGKIREVPMSFSRLLSSPWIWPYIPTLVKGWKKQPDQTEDLSIYEYFSKRFSPRVAETFIDPLVAGIYAGDPKQLSMKSCFPSFGKRGIYTLKSGLSALPLALEKKLGDAVIKNQTVRKLERTGEGWKAGEFFGKKVISTLPAYVIGELIGERELQEIPYASVTTVHVGFKKRLLPREGFGYLVPRQERESILGMVWDSSAFPEQNRHPEETRVTVMIGGEEERGESVALNVLKKHLGISDVPDFIHSSIQKRAIPQFSVGYSDKIERIVNKLSLSSPGLILAGSYRSGVSVNDCLSYGISGVN